MKIHKKHEKKYNYRITFYFKSNVKKSTPQVVTGIYSFDKCITPETKVEELIKTNLTTKHENAGRLNELFNSEGSTLDIVVTDIQFLGQS